MFKILWQPYPFSDKSVWSRLRKCLLEGAGIGLFFVFFQPFGLNEWQHPNKLLVLMGYGVIVSICTAIHRFALPRLFPSIYIEEKWVLWKEIVHILVLLLLITIGNLLYSKIFFSFVPLSFLGFIVMFFLVATIGVIPISFGVMSNYIYQLKKYNQTIVVQHAQVVPIEEKKAEPLLKLTGENEKDIIEMKAENLFYIESSDNYSTVFFEKNKALHKELLRSSLTRLESQIEAENIVRCHRSYVVNLDKVEKVTGNAQGYKLHLRETEFVVPVARKYSEIVERLK